MKKREKQIEEMDGEELKKFIQELGDKIKDCIRSSRHHFQLALQYDRKKERAELRLEQLGWVGSKIGKKRKEGI